MTLKSCTFFWISAIYGLTRLQIFTPFSLSLRIIASDDPNMFENLDLTYAYAFTYADAFTECDDLGTLAPGDDLAGRDPQQDRVSNK